MALDDESPNENTVQTHLITTFEWPTRRRILLRRRKLPTLRLGGKKARQGFFMLRMLRKVRLRRLKLRYSCMLRKLKEYYRNLLKDVLAAGATIETYQQRLVRDLAGPVMGFSFYQSMALSNVSRSTFM